MLAAAQAGDMEAVRGLIPLADRSAVSTALLFASHRGHADAARLLVEAGADASVRGRVGASPLALHPQCCAYVMSTWLRCLPLLSAAI